MPAAGTGKLHATAINGGGRSCFGDLPADVFETILLRIPPSARRRLRLVCPHWSDVIDERMPETRTRGAKTLAFVNSRPDGAAAYVLDDLVEGRSREVWSSAAEPNLAARYSCMTMVGTCNGLVCMHNERADNVVLLNPVTGETLDVPGPGHRFGHVAFSFSYLETTGQYKIVHLPVRRPTSWELDGVQVLTLGEDASWRFVSALAGTSCNHYLGVVSVDGATYWITEDRYMLMSFDLKDERVARVRALPAPPHGIDVNCLTEVGGMVGLIADVRSRKRSSRPREQEAWVLERGGRRWLGRSRSRRRWRRRFTVFSRRSTSSHGIMVPHFVQGEHLLTDFSGSLYAHGCGSSAATPARPQCSVVLQIGECCPWIKPVFTYDHRRSLLRTFSYVETT